MAYRQNAPSCDPLKEYIPNVTAHILLVTVFNIDIKMLGGGLHFGISMRARMVEHQGLWNRPFL